MEIMISEKFNEISEQFCYFTYTQKYFFPVLILLTKRAYKKLDCFLIFQKRFITSQ